MGHPWRFYETTFNDGREDKGIPNFTSDFRRFKAGLEFKIKINFGKQ